MILLSLKVFFFFSLYCRQIYCLCPPGVGEIFFFFWLTLPFFPGCSFTRLMGFLSTWSQAWVGRCCYFISESIMFPKQFLPFSNFSILSLSCPILFLSSAWLSPPHWPGAGLTSPTGDSHFLLICTVPLSQSQSLCSEADWQGKPLLLPSPT